MNKDFFEVFIPVPKNQAIADEIKSKASSLSSIYKVTIIEEEEMHAAMCASDFAVMHNGEITA